jgi:CheY-like chemotaxis protein
MEQLGNILLVEDDERDVELTLTALSEYNLANRVVVTNDGPECMEYLKRTGRYAERPEGKPAVILLDVKMPGLNGVEVLKLIRNSEQFKKIPVVMLTSSREGKDISECYEHGVNAYVVKPVEFHNFIEAVKNLGVFWAVVNEPPKPTIV